MPEKYADSTRQQPTIIIPAVIFSPLYGILVYMSADANLLRNAFRYLIKFSADLCIIHIDRSLTGGGGGGGGDRPIARLVADLVILHRLGLRLIIILQSPVLPEKTDRGIARAQRHIESGMQVLVREFSRQRQEVVGGTGSDGGGGWVRSRVQDARGGETGTDGHRSTDGDPALGSAQTGVITRININAITKLTDKKIIPIIPPLGRNSAGTQHLLESYHIVEELTRAADISKVLLLESDSLADRWAASGGSGAGTGARTGLPNQLLSNELTARRIAAFPEFMHPRLRMARTVLANGVKRVHIIGEAARIHDNLLEELFLPVGARDAAVMVYTGEYENIRPLRRADIAELLELRRPLAARGLLRDLSAQDIAQDIGAHFVYVLDGVIVAAISCTRRPNGYYEIGGMTTMRDHRNDGIAGKLLQYVCRRLSGKEKGRGAVLFALTARAREWFLRQGFIETDPADLPAELRKEILLRLQARGAKRHLLSARSDALRPVG